MAAHRRDGRPDHLGAHGAAGDGLCRDRRSAGPEWSLRDAARGGRLCAVRQLAPPLCRPQRDSGDAVRLVGGCGRHCEHGLRRVRRPDLRPDAHGRRDLRCRRPCALGIRRPLLRTPGARGLHRRARPLYRDRPAAEGGGNREAVGQHGLGARENDRPRRQLGVDDGRGRGRRARRAVRARSLRAEAPRGDHRRGARGARGRRAGPAGPRRGDRRRRADRLPVRLAVERFGARPRGTSSRRPRDRDRRTRAVARDRQELRREVPLRRRREPRDAWLRHREHRCRRAAGLHRHRRALAVGDGRARRREIAGGLPRHRG